jgi:hypothetical protein
LAQGFTTILADGNSIDRFVIKTFHRWPPGLSLLDRTLYLIQASSANSEAMKKERAGNRSCPPGKNNKKAPKRRWSYSIFSFVAGGCNLVFAS